MVMVRDDGVIAVDCSLESVPFVLQDPVYIKWRGHPFGMKVLKFVEQNIATMSRHMIGCIGDVKEFGSLRSALRIVHKVSKKG